MQVTQTPTIDYLRYLLDQSPNQRLLLFWDGASYHRSHLVQNFLGQINQGLSQSSVDKVPASALLVIAHHKIPLSDIWLQAKTWVRRLCALIPSFSHLKWMEEVVYPTHKRVILPLSKCTELFHKSNISPIILQTLFVA